MERRLLGYASAIDIALHPKQALWRTTLFKTEIPLRSGTTCPPVRLERALLHFPARDPSSTHSNGKNNSTFSPKHELNFHVGDVFSWLGKIVFNCPAHVRNQCWWCSRVEHFWEIPIPMLLHKTGILAPVLTIHNMRVMGLQ